MASEPPKQFGRCRLVKRLGHGATAVVFLARHEVLEVNVAVKVLRKKLSQGRPEFAERFLREARMAARLEHPNIVRVFDCGIEDGYHYMVMDYVDGPNCQEIMLSQQCAMDWREATRIARQIADGLAYAAQKGVIHRDVKPSNVLIDSTGRARISDLGLAKLAVRGPASLTQELHTVGTPNYMSPEQISSPSDLDLRADIYSLGAALYHMVCGVPPYTGDNPMKVVAQHLTAPLIPPIERNPNLSPAISSIICKMMAKSVEERYHDYESLCRDLDNMVAGRAVDAAGFSDTQTIVMNDEVLQDVLEELHFAEGLEIDLGEVEEDDLDRAAEQGSTKVTRKPGTSTVYTFGAADLVAFSASSDGQAEEEEEEGAYASGAPILRIRRKPRSSALVVAMVFLGVIALFALAVFIGFLLGPGPQTRPASDAGEPPAKRPAK